MFHQPDRDRWEQVVDTPLPEWIQVQQKFPSIEEKDITAAVCRELSRPEIRHYLRPGLSVAIGVGSRGLASLHTLVAATVRAVKDAGCSPFIIPAMGSHGGATAAGQVKLLEEYGITEATVGAPIYSSMDVVEIGKLPSGLPIYFDKRALSTDLLIPINRIKPHTSFRGQVESGLTKMLVIGFGKHKGATALHKEGFKHLSTRLKDAVQIIEHQTPFGFGLGIVENAYHRVALVEAVPATILIEREAELLNRARQLMARLQFKELDVLVVGSIGKNISGTGMDPNVTGRFATSIEGELRVERIVVLGLTPETRGSAVGLGMADVTTARVIHEMDSDTTWINCVTSTNLQSARIPIFMPNDLMAIQLAIKTCPRDDPKQVRIAWIHNTLALEQIYISEALWGEIAGHSEFTPINKLGTVPFDIDGNLMW